MRLFFVFYIIIYFYLFLFINDKAIRKKLSLPNPSLSLPNPSNTPDASNKKYQTSAKGTVQVHAPTAAPTAAILSQIQLDEITRCETDLQPDIDTAVKHHWNSPHNKVKIVSHITVESFRRLQSETQWLNDAIINESLNLLKSKDDDMCKADSTRRGSQYLSSFFMERLVKTNNGYCYENIRRWSKQNASHYYYYALLLLFSY